MLLVSYEFLLKLKYYVMESEENYNKNFGFTFTSRLKLSKFLLVNLTSDITGVSETKAMCCDDT